MTQGWAPVEERRTDTLVAGPLQRLAALFDHDAAHWPHDSLPPLAHWLYFLPNDAQSRLAADGHPVRGAFLPPIDAPRRMWAGGRVTFHAPLPIGAAATRHSIVTDVREKLGRSGALNFVTVRHEVHAAGMLAVTEEQDLVFRPSNVSAPAAAHPDLREPAVSREIVPDVTALFRFSALTFNAHRIHYDRPYAQWVEGYPDLVVHGPLQAMLLVDHLLRERPGSTLTHFAYRGVRPMFADRALRLNLADGSPVALWTTDPDGCTGMDARATLA
ncbi:MaoC family dehydratase N-terminal domain-containing protein [uncultured Sphingomonas sp.]|uniref:FAS1-like dehydratase domain-containing protein n=1 Tax=uncultured Sphingomonas sp. TaxID=158754 RepID=UPI002622066D|nr:MaoC family dehydratase N-terminal domain-containing protein [uncultured Sphingomonas sp.]